MPPSVACAQVGVSPFPSATLGGRGQPGSCVHSQGWPMSLTIAQVQRVQQVPGILPAGQGQEGLLGGYRYLYEGSASPLSSEAGLLGST